MFRLNSQISSYWLNLLCADHLICIGPVPIQQIRGEEVVLRHESKVCNAGFGINEQC